MDIVIPRYHREALSQLVECFDKYHWNYALIGATALISHGINLGRATLDLDMVVVVDRDKDFHLSLTECGFGETQTAHRFRWGETLIDVIPISKIAHKDFIYWPTGEKMNVIGFREAVEHAVTLDIPIDNSRISIKVAPIPLIIFLKLLACAERKDFGDHEHAHKHMEDIITCLRQYESSGTRRFEYIDAVKGVKDEFECAGAFLMGLDLRKYSSESIVKLFGDILDSCLTPVLDELERMLLNCMRTGFEYNG